MIMENDEIITTPSRNTHCVKNNRETQFTGTYNECFTYILNHQPQSVNWATKFGGWSIDRIEQGK